MKSNELHISIITITKIRTTFTSCFLSTWDHCIVWKLKPRPLPTLTMQVNYNFVSTVLRINVTAVSYYVIPWVGFCFSGLLIPRLIPSHFIKALIRDTQALIRSVGISQERGSSFCAWTIQSSAARPFLILMVFFNHLKSFQFDLRQVKS